MSRAAALALAIAMAACGRGHGSIDAPRAAIAITARWPGHAPADAMTAVADPIEELVAHVDGIDHVATTCRDDGSCVVTALVADGADPEVVARGVRDGLQPILRRLPDDLDGPPTVERHARGAIMRVNVRTPGDAVTTRRLVDALVHRIEMTDGVSGVDACGGATERIAVAIDPRQLAEYGLGVVDVADAVAHANTNVSGGTLDVGGQDYTIRTAGDRSSEEISALVISAANGVPVHLRDVATIAHGQVATPCTPRVADDRAVIDVRVPDGDDAQRPIADAIRAGARELRVEVEIVHGPARYAIAIAGGDARTIAARWRVALGGAGSVDVEPGPARTGVWTIDRDATARAGVSAVDASRAVELMTGHLQLSTLYTQGERIPIEVGSADPDPEHVIVVGGEHPVHVSEVARRADVDDRADRFDRQPAAIIHVSVPGTRRDPDAIVRDAIAAAQAAAPAPAGATITVWREP